jgi:hypothetical protein
MNRMSVLHVRSGWVLFLVANCLAQTAEAPRLGHANVELFAIGSRGEELNGCAVTNFMNTDTHENVAQNFRRLQGKNIGFGTYLVYLRCGAERGASSVVTVSRAQHFFVISSTQGPAIHYAPGRGPALTVRIKGLTEPPGGPVWIQVAGLYRDERVAARVVEGSATISIEGEGLYQLTIFRENQALCNGVVAVNAPNADMEVTLGDTCVLSATNAVSLQNLGKRLVPR